MANEIDIVGLLRYWVEEAEESIQVAEHLLDKEDYSYALFFGHLAIEKLLKASYVANKSEHAPPIHNLLRLAKLAGLELEPDAIEQLILITSFNIESRYPDLKRSFRKKCTKEYTQDQMKTIKDIFQWLRLQLK
jgi:HEPN domain-containing protein